MALSTPTTSTSTPSAAVLWRAKQPKFVNQTNRIPAHATIFNNRYWTESSHLWCHQATSHRRCQDGFHNE